ncbi:hypothetical protein ABT324_31810 [Saccharopolyspora sp. NPDC000359]|uniref:LppU/SCO3897 family protein n=1 Tax=Saccharopolyspora sp. NPDC000359 TaxID=3154251 RepID=UPI00331E2C2F
MTQPPPFGQQPQWGPPPQQQWGQQPVPGGPPPQGYPPQGYPQQPMPPQQGYPQQAYPQQPPMQQPVPQQGWQGGPPPGYPAGPPPQQQGGGGKKALGWVGTVVLAIVVVGGGALIRSFDGGGIAVGECVDVTNPSTTRPEWDKVACGSTESDYKVAKQLDGHATCSSDYDSLEKRGDYVMCLVPDVEVGDCLTAPMLDLSTKVSCSDPDAAQEVTTVANNTSGDAACTDDSEKYLTWNEPPLTMCWKSA